MFTHNTQYIAGSTLKSCYVIVHYEYFNLLLYYVMKIYSTQSFIKLIIVRSTTNFILFTLRSNVTDLISGKIFRKTDTNLSGKLLVVSVLCIITVGVSPPYTTYIIVLIHNAAAQYLPQVCCVSTVMQNIPGKVKHYKVNRVSREISGECF